MTKENYFINVNFLQTSAKKHIYNNFDYELTESLYDTYDDDGLPIIYNFLYKYIKTLPQNKTIITLSPDPIISASTISAIAEKYLTITDNKGLINYSSNLKIIYFTSTPHLIDNYQDLNIENLSKTIISNLLCLTDFTYTKHQLALSPNQFILIGLNDDLICSDEKEKLDNNNITYFTLNQIHKKGISNIIKSINEIILDDPVHIVFDMTVMHYESVPCVKTLLSNKYGFSISTLEEAIININKNNIVGLDITSFDLRINETENMYRITCEVAKIVLKHLLNITEKKINIFNENSRFLIWRPIDQQSHDDIGWFILRGVSLDAREQIMKQLDKDNIIIFTITNDDQNDTDDNDKYDEDVLISTTTMAEQEEKIYYTAENIYECTLFPEEKVHMMFELLNTNENVLHND